MCYETWHPLMKERKACEFFLLMENEMLQYERVDPLMGRLHLYILIGLVLLVTINYVSLIVPLKLEGVQKHIQLEMRKYKERCRKYIG